MRLLRYIELKTGYDDNGPAWIGYATPSKTGRTLYFNGRALSKLKGQNRSAEGGNYIDVENRDAYWVSAIKMNGRDRHWAGSGKITIEDAAVPEYLQTIGASALETDRFDVRPIPATDVRRFDVLANTSYRESGQP